MPWYLYERATKRVHQVEKCVDANRSPRKVTVGSNTWDNMDEAVKEARLLLDAEAIACWMCEYANSLLSDEDWREMVGRWLHT